MTFNHSPKSIFYTLTVTTLLLTGCSGGGSSNNSTVETAAVAAISGVVNDTDGNGLNDITVELDDGTQAKVIASVKTATVNGTDGQYTIQPTTTGTFQLKFSNKENDGRNFITQFKSVTAGSSEVTAVTPTTLSKVDTTKLIPITGDTISAIDNTVTQKAIDVSIPANAAGEAIDVSLTLLTGTEIPSTLPTEEGKTLLPVGAISLGISPSTITDLATAATASVPVPVALQSNPSFPVYRLNETTAKWEPQTGNDGQLNSPTNDTVSFQIQTAGTYMVMSDVPDVTDANIGATTSTTTSTPENVAPGSTVTNKTVTNNIEVGSNSPAFNTLPQEDQDAFNNLPQEEKDEVDALVKNLLEQQNQTQFGNSETPIIVVPSVSSNKQSVSDLAAKLVCTISRVNTISTFIFRFTFRNTTIAIPVTITIGRFVVSCEDVPDPTGATGGTN